MFIENKYTKWYMLIVSRAQHRVNVNQYTEAHHIIPKSLGGKNTKDNLVRLTGREHYICHLLLTRMLEGELRKKMLYAFVLMAGHPVKRDGTSREYKRMNSHLFQSLKQAFRETISEARKGKPVISKNPEVSREKRSTKLKGRKFSDETKAKMAASAKARSVESRLGRIQTEETRRKISETMRKKNYKSSKSSTLSAM